MPTAEMERVQQQLMQETAKVQQVGKSLCVHVGPHNMTSLILTSMLQAMPRMHRRRAC
mgnify:CR=1 FL=1